MPEFDKLWDDPKKHEKRLKHWLPHWRALANALKPKRRMRFLTLCARSMIDVFMLVREKILVLDPKSRSISDVYFCECEPADHAEIEEMLGRQGSGFFGKIEDILLFEEDAFSRQFRSLDEVMLKLEEEESLNRKEVQKLREKLTHLNVFASFPYDCINLDFCGYYYPEPPGMLRINDAVKKILEWQRSSSDESEVSEFLLNVTCRHGDKLPSNANARLKEIIKSNIQTHQRYKEAFEASRPKQTLDGWMKNDSEDFFWSGWPKDIAESAKQFGWSTEILSCVFYRRQGPDGARYMIACLVLKFSLSQEEPEFLSAALHALDTSKRTEIRQIDRKSQQGRKLLSNLSGIVKLRNEQARARRRQSLPLPKA